MRRCSSVRQSACSINHAVGDAATGRNRAGGGGNWFAAVVWRRDGGTWTLSKGPFDPARQVWSLARDGDRMLAGTKPAMLWESHDQSESWAKLPALTEQPGADEWPPGAAGLVLHTILCGGQGRVWVGISPGPVPRLTAVSHGNAVPAGRNDRGRQARRNAIGTGSRSGPKARNSTASATWPLARLTL